jgi:alpha-tubulin suppressor-like RCC1 family protein
VLAVVAGAGCGHSKQRSPTRAAAGGAGGAAATLGSGGLATTGGSPAAGSSGGRGAGGAAGHLGTGGSSAVLGTAGFAGGGTPGQAGSPAGFGGSAAAGAPATGGSAGRAAAGAGNACSTLAEGGAPERRDCDTPRTDCDRHASCFNVDGVDGCVCDDNFFGDGLTCDGPRAATAIATSDQVSCAVIGSGKVRCWGNSEYGALGTGDLIDDIGDDEPASAGRLVPLDLPVKDLAVGDLTTCALFESGDVRCWGYGYEGQLGTGTLGNAHDPATAANVDLGGKAVALSGNSRHFCALLDTGGLRCWGGNGGGQLGYGDTNQGQTPAAAGDLPLPGRVLQVSASNDCTCAVVEGGEVYCWGAFRFTLPNGPHAGDAVGTVPPIDVGVKVKQVAASSDHVCAVTEAGNVRCWGGNASGRLGYVIFNEEIGDDESIDSAGDVDVGGEVEAVVVGSQHTCALLTTGSVRCWGYFGGFAYGNYEPIGDNETPAEAGDAALGGTVAHLSVAPMHTCALMTDGAVRCWGDNNYGALGYGNLSDVGDLSPPVCAGEVPIF